MCQLVRLVMDFSSISYVLAYDEKRVIQALGHELGPERRNAEQIEEAGRS